MLNLVLPLVEVMNIIKIINEKSIKKCMDIKCGWMV
jgi:hypothetical protein